MIEVWFWQKILSPHMAHLAGELVVQGVKVTYVAQEPMSDDRKKLGWSAPELTGVDIHYVTTSEEVRSLISRSPSTAEHICQGIRGNGYVSIAQAALASRGRNFWVMMETVDDTGYFGVTKRALYWLNFWRLRHQIRGVLSIGRKTGNWIKRQGVSADLIYPFAYFLSPKDQSSHELESGTNVFEILFVGQLIERKRVDLLIEAIAGIKIDCPDITLQVIGVGPCEDVLRVLADSKLSQAVQWLGQLPMNEVRRRMSAVDCLVLPSRHDGWGAVVSESLMAGTPAICSDACGAAEVVYASGNGGVFLSGDQKALQNKLREQYRRGKNIIKNRNKLAQWGMSLGAACGAAYLKEIMLHRSAGGARPSAPWLR